MKRCLQCGIEYSNESTIEVGSKCPKQFCRGIIVDLEETFDQAIEILEEKGYSIESSHAGNMWKEDPSVWFREEFQLRTFASLPNKFRSEKYCGKGLKITKKITSTDISTRLKSINDAALELLKWANSLSSPIETLLQFKVKSIYDPMSLVTLIKKELNLFHGNYITDFVSDGDWGNGYDYSFSITPENFDKLEEELEEFASENKVEFNFYKVKI